MSYIYVRNLIFCGTKILKNSYFIAICLPVLTSKQDFYVTELSYIASFPPISATYVIM